MGIPHQTTFHGGCRIGLTSERRTALPHEGRCRGFTISHQPRAQACWLGLGEGRPAGKALSSRPPSSAGPGGPHLTAFGPSTNPTSAAGDHRLIPGRHSCISELKNAGKLRADLVNVLERLGVQPDHIEWLSRLLQARLLQGAWPLENLKGHVPSWPERFEALQVRTASTSEACRLAKSMKHCAAGATPRRLGRMQHGPLREG